MLICGQAFEAEMLTALAGARSLFAAPALLAFDREGNTQVHEDFPRAIDLISVLRSPTTTNDVLMSLWGDLGARLRGFHEWTSKPEQDDLRATFARNESMRRLKYDTTYKTFISILEKYPELLEGCRGTLQDVRDVVTEEYETPAGELVGSDLGLIHGDFWSGK